MKIVFSLFLLVIVSATVTKCGFDPNDFPAEVVPLQKSKTVKDTNTFESIRFYKHVFDMPKIQGQGVTPAKITEVAENVLNKIQGFLKVHRTTENIKVPAEALKVEDQTVPETHTNPGVENTDYVVYFVETDCGIGNTIATAGPKYLDGNHRPYIGVVHLCISKASSMIDEQAYYEVVVLHEMMHALGYGTIFNYMTDMVKNTTVNEKKFQQIVSPKVVETAKKHFGCDSLTGALLENDGGSGTANSHWEITLYSGELMVGWISSTKPNKLTSLTLSWLEDTGFYEVDYSAGEELTYGKNEGCAMTELKCKDDDGKPLTEFCDVNVKEQCSSDYQGRGKCVDDNTNGYNCPVVSIYSNGICNNPSNKNENDYYFALYYGVNGFCQYNTNFTIKGVTGGSFDMCARVQCPPSIPTEYQIVLCPLEAGCSKDSDYIIATCKKDDEEITVNGYNGKIKCGKRELVCSESNGYDTKVDIIDAGDQPTGSPTKSPTESPTESPTKSPTESPTADGGDDNDNDGSNVSNIYVICSMLLFITLTLF